MAALKKLLLLADILANGGQERQLALLATSLPADWRVRVWAMRGGAFERYLRERGVEVCLGDRRSRFDPLPAARLWRQLAEWRPDVVHAWSWISSLAAVPACRVLRIPLIDGMIQSGERESDPLGLKRLGMRWATLVVANTRSGLASWPVSRSRGRVVYNGFDWSRLEHVDTRSGRDDLTFTVVMAARMDPVKHYEVVMEAARRLSRDSKGWRFLLAGDGPQRPRLMSLAGELVEAGVVQFLTPGLEVLGVVAQAQVGVLMTNPAIAREGLSNSIMEYMALGLPVVCSDGGGSPELVLEGATGFLIPPGDAGALADRLAFLREHEDVRSRMGAAGRARIVDAFSVDRMAKDMIAVYEEALAGRVK